MRLIKGVYNKRSFKLYIQAKKVLKFWFSFITVI